MIVGQEDEEHSINGAHRVTAFTGIVSSSQIGLNTTLNYIIENFDVLRSK